MIIRATITLADQSIRSRDFNDEMSANEWLAVVGQNQTYGDPATYTTSVVDVTAQEAQAESDKAAIKRGRAKQDVGADAVAMLNQVHEEMALDQAAMVALVSDQRLMMAVTLVRNGAIIMGRDMFLSVASSHYTADQIARIIKPINESEFAT
jgi:hypothetical protein